MRQVRTALYGYGKVAHLHARALASIPASEFAAVCGRHLQKAQVFAAEYGIAAYDDLAAMIAAEGIEAIIVCSPHPAHAGPAVTAAQAGVHVLVEKPLAASLRDCDAMIAAADAAGVKLSVISQRRLYEPVRRVRQAIDAGKIGRPVLGLVQMFSWRDQAYYESDPWRGTWDAEGGGVLINQSPHQFDLLLWFMGEIDSLFGYWDNLNHPYIDVDDTAVAVIRFKNGGLGNIVVSNSQKPGLYGKVHIHGANGASVGVQPEGGAMFIAGMTSIQDPPINDLWTVPGEEHLLAQWQAEDKAFFDTIDPTLHYIRLQDEDFLHAILEDRDPIVTGRDGRAVVELSAAIYRSQRTNAPVTFPLSDEPHPETRP